MKKTAIANNVKLNDLKSVLTELGVPLKLTEATVAKDINSIPIKSLLLKETADNNKELILTLQDVPMDKFIKPIISALGNLKVRCQVRMVMLCRIVLSFQCIVFQGSRSRQ